MVVKIITYHKRMVNIHNTTYVVNVGDVHLVKPRIYASKLHVIRARFNPWNSIVLVNNTWKK